MAGGADGADSCAFDAYRRPAAGFRYDGDTGSLRTADARSFAGTIYGGIAYGLVIVSGGLTLSYYANLAPGGTIVLTGTCMFI